MDWKQIRSAFIRARGTRPQHVIAAEGGLRQNAISKLELNNNLGPAVETFVKAIEGLGVKPSEFFAGIEEGRDKVGQSPGKNPPLNIRDEASTNASLHPTLGADVEDPALRARALGDSDPVFLRQLAGALYELAAMRERAERSRRETQAPQKRLSRHRKGSGKARG